jgi:hypothetical protein
MRKEAQEREQKSREELAKVLNEGQMKRLSEISIQVRGTGALSDPEVAAKLSLTDVQKEEISQTQRELAQQGQGQRGGGQGFDGLRDLSEEERRARFEEIRKQAEQRRKENDEKVLANLSEEQRKQFEALKGATFTMPEGVFGFGGFGGGRGGEGRRPGGDGARPGGDGGRPGGDGGRPEGNRPRRPDSA